MKTKESIEIRSFRPDDAAAFFSLNERWIAQHFGMEPRDHANLGDPKRTILDQGGHILMAFINEQAVGCCALIWEGHSICELAKMTVAEEFRGKGIGRQLVVATISLARSLGIRRLKLGSNTALRDAVHLYESVGFRHLSPENFPFTDYARANVFMEMDL